MPGFNIEAVYGRVNERSTPVRFSSPGITP
jgi:hypothetical protein